MLNQRTLLRQKQRANMQCLSMVHLAIFLGQVISSARSRLLDDEAHLSCCTEVGDGNENNFFKHRVLAELVRRLEGVFVVVFWFIEAAHMGICVTFRLIFTDRWEFIYAH